MAVKSKFYVATPSGWVEANFGGTGSGSFYGVSSESSNTRIVALTNDDGNFELVAGATINVKFTSASSTGTMTLNVKGTGAKTIMGGGGLTPTWTAGSIINFIYDDASEDGAWIMQTNFAIISGIIDVVETNSGNIVDLQDDMSQMQNTMGQIQEGFIGINNKITQLEGAPLVSYERQELTTTQKTQARTNIGAGTSSFSGSYNDLTSKPTIPAAQIQSDWNQTNSSKLDYIKNKPTIPTVNNATLTIQKNGSTVATFTANASSNATANITVPTKVSELTNDSEYTTQTWVTNQGYSKLIIGTTSGTAAAGNHTHSEYASSIHNHIPDNITGPIGSAASEGPFLLTNAGSGATTKWIEKGELLNGYATQSWVNSKGYTKLEIGTTATTAAAGNHNHDTAYAGKNHTHSEFSPINHSHSAKEILPASEVDDYILVSQINDDPVWCSPSDLGLATQTWVNNQKYSKLELGTTSTTAAKGDHTHSNILTTAPTSANTSGEMRFVVLSSEPNARYSGYLYIITG